MGSSTAPAILSGSSPTDYHLFRSMSNHMRGTTFDDEEDLKTWLNNFFYTRPGDFWWNIINKLVERWEEVPTGYSLRSGTKKALKEELGIVDGGKSDSKGQTESDSSKENLLKDEKPDIAPGSSQVEPNVAALVTVLNNQQQLLNKLVELHLATGQERMAKMEVERFNGKNVDPLIWIRNYEIICQNNNWKSSQTKIPPCFGMTAKIKKKVADGDWEEWKNDFIEAFREDPINRFDKAVKWQYRSGSYVDYFYKN
ncbi:hypothetical protein LAZ67_7002141 [Cordylochernes scorpioides]|uniref:Uncharacterized protein n=1 Tax=Cordylochernes scorpioides TaxID=51811 RepID=A0ABY6KNS7_9ARAC|nr:hypothetical protein LAZ67_7002141 [Cordylochernes scorpioides]